MWKFLFAFVDRKLRPDEKVWIALLQEVNLFPFEILKLYFDHQLPETNQKFIHLARHTLSLHFQAHILESFMTHEKIHIPLLLVTDENEFQRRVKLENFSEKKTFQLAKELLEKSIDDPFCRVDILLQNIENFNINKVKDSQGMTLLHICAKKQEFFPQTIKLLLEKYEADPLYPDSSSNTPLLLATLTYGHAGYDMFMAHFLSHPRHMFSNLDFSERTRHFHYTWWWENCLHSPKMSISLLTFLKVYVEPCAFTLFLCLKYSSSDLLLTVLQKLVKYKEF
jgi:hypothetical protein